MFPIALLALVLLLAACEATAPPKTEASSETQTASIVLNADGLPVLTPTGSREPKAVLEALAMLVDMRRSLKAQAQPDSATTRQLLLVLEQQAEVQRTANSLIDSIQDPEERLQFLSALQDVLGESPVK